MQKKKHKKKYGYTLRSRELCDLFTECRRHEVKLIRNIAPRQRCITCFYYGAYSLSNGGLLHWKRIATRKL